MIDGIIFNNRTVTAQGMRSALAHGDGILSGCAFSYSGETFTIGAGCLSACGGAFRLTSAESINCGGAASGYARIKAILDMNGASSASSFNQVSFAVEYAASASDFPALTKDDINTSGQIYELEIATVSLGVSGITGIFRAIGSIKAMLDDSEHGTALPDVVGVAGQIFYKVVG